LLILAKIQKEREVENNTTNQSTKPPLIFKPYNTNSKLSVVFIPKISITQQPIIDQGVNIPKIYIPDPININPNSIANIEKVFLHIETISGIKDEICKWLTVTYDGIPYHHATKLKEKFP